MRLRLNSLSITKPLAPKLPKVFNPTKMRLKKRPTILKPERFNTFQSPSNLSTFSVEYRGHTFPGYNKPIKSWNKNKKKAVLVKKGDKVKIVHYGHKSYEDYTQHKDKKRRKNYLTRSAGIRDKNGNLTKNNKFSPNYWARRDLW